MKPTLIVMTLVLASLAAACSGKEQHSGTSSSNTERAEDAKGNQREGISLTAQQIQTAGIGLAQVGPADLREQLSLYGVIAPNAERTREIAARFPGVIRTVTRRIGDPVQQGEVIATIESNESLQTYAVRSPLSGTVMARQANPGEQSTDKSLFTVADLSTVWVELSLFPRDAGKVRIGQSVRVKGNDTDLTGDGKVIHVAPFGSSANQTLTARVLLENRYRRWSPGLYVTAEVTTSQTQVPLAIRKAGVQTLHDQPVVFVRSGEEFQARTLKLGRRDSEVTEVLSGVSAGEWYATANSYVLKAEALKSEAEED